MIFYKYHGTGNDFVMLDFRQQDIRLDESQIAMLCHRRFGIGSDGLIILTDQGGYDFRMYYYNANGKEGSMCGNGGRCAVQFAKDLGIITKEETYFLAVDGPHKATLSAGQVTLKMIDVNTDEIFKAEDYFTMDTGSPHYVAFVNDLDDYPVMTEGRRIRHSDAFDEGGGNVNFAAILSDHELQVRTYERGVEDETFSCGTGVTACALAFALERGASSPIQIKTKGGTLSVSFQQNNNGFDQIYLTGPAKCVCRGEIDL